MNVLIMMECSGALRDRFNAAGHNAFSVDMKPSETETTRHFQEDAFEVATRYSWDMIIAHPPCTFLSVSGIFRNNTDALRARKTALAATDFMNCVLSKAPRVAVENPIGVMSTLYRKPDQIVQPYQFGDDASKATCWWLKGLPLLRIDPAKRKAGRSVVFKGKEVERWANQTDSGQNRLGPSENRATERSRTYPGIADACVEAWG